MFSARVILPAMLVATLFATPTAAMTKKQVDAVDRCMAGYASCVKKCDTAPNTDRVTYRTCNSSCDRRFNSCYRKSQEAVGGGGDGGGNFSPRNDELFQGD